MKYIRYVWVEVIKPGPLVTGTRLVYYFALNNVLNYMYGIFVQFQFQVETCHHWSANEPVTKSLLSSRVRSCLRANWPKFLVNHYSLHLSTLLDQFGPLVRKQCRGQLKQQLNIHWDIRLPLRLLRKSIVSVITLKLIIYTLTFLEHETGF